MGRSSLGLGRGIHRLRRGVSHVFFLVYRHVVRVHCDAGSVTFVFFSIFAPYGLVLTTTR